jgi:hypothetical protein
LRTSHHPTALAAALVLVAVALCGGACKDKKRERRAPGGRPRRHPADAAVVVSIGVPQLARPTWWRGPSIRC